ncbi:hypothetical protein J2S13_000314 [Oikeobacillus pervagus]|uniref:Sporulation protein YqfD n=1 Tax=Oikeobacillus pervagus TaxID=1325931 RepID=A0AAJ1T2Z6_9BACI|nr:sporulation protein YqfD [Oikeobacillus pervagus]MDQ0213920.1 hypothetical protein [Oikeobacillus pervagus]
MKNQWVTFVKGKILIKAEGRGVERFINQLTRSQLPIWDVKKHGSEAITFYIFLTDVHKLREAARSFDGDIRLMRGGGAPFLWKRLLKNAGFLIGNFAFFAVILILSNMVWGIEIKGASPAMEHAIRKELTNMGIKKGELQFFVDDVETIQRKLSERVDGITWVGVQLKGTTFHFQVVEKNQPKQEGRVGPQNLVAKKKAVIVKLFVEEGQALVKKNQYVTKGQILVSGLIGNEEEEKQIAAKGIVMGETWYKSTVEIPLQSKFEVYNGNELRKQSLVLGGVKIPIWGGKKIKFANYKIEEDKKDVKFLKWKLPIQYVKTTVRENEEITRKYSKEEAYEVAKNLARKDLNKKIAKDAKITGEKILHEQIENGKVRLTIYFQVVENIAVGHPIIQGDKKDDRKDKST